MNKKLKKIIIYFTGIIFVSTILLLFYLFIPNSLKSFDGKLRDYMFIVRGEIPQPDNVIIIDIDEKSLKKIGQWPWSRDVLSKLLINLTKNDIGLIAFDMVFAEEDRTNPSNILKKLDIKINNRVLDYDTFFANTVSQTPTILGYQFQLNDNKYIEKKSPLVPAIFIEKNKPEKDEVIEAKGTILNIPIVQDNAYSSGFFNSIPDESGIIRSVPLVIRYNEQLYPSLALETIRTISNTNKVIINYDNIGISDIEVGDFNIPTDQYGRLLVNYRGGEKTFNYYSASDILEGIIEKSKIEGRIALIGTSAAGLLDLRATPFESVYPGVEVHANVIDNILTGDFIVKPSWIEGLNIIHIIILVVLVFILLGYLPSYIAIPFIFILSSVDIYLIYTSLFTYGLILNIFFPVIAIIVSTLVVTTVNYILETKQNKMIKEKFATKVSPAVMHDLLQQDKNVFAATEKEITIFFSDVRNFTNISEAIGNPKNLIDFMNEYMDPMTDIIIQTGGTIDKFIGDAIMAYWNAPVDVANHANQAVVATLNQLHTVKQLNLKMREDIRFKSVVEMADKMQKPIIDIGIGLNTGIAIVGEMGSSSRADYTCIGDPINLAARLESLCKYYDSKCNISNFTKEKLNKDDYIFRFLDLVTVKGKNEPIEIWQIHDFKNGKDNEYLFNLKKEELDKELELYHKAINLYKNSKFSEALKIFENINNWDRKANREIYKIYIDRCEIYIKNPPKNFNGIYIHTTKG